MTVRLLALFCACALAAPSVSFADSAGDDHNLLELRDTVINLIQALVQRGVITREQAEKMIQDAKAKAQAEVAQNEAAKKAQEEADKGAVRVPYVPQIVKDEIKKEVVDEITPSVKQQVAADLSAPGTVASALPDWVRRMVWTGDVRVRYEGDNFGRDNAQDSYLDFNAVNAAGGIIKAGAKAYRKYHLGRRSAAAAIAVRLRCRSGVGLQLGHAPRNRDRRGVRDAPTRTSARTGRPTRSPSTRDGFAGAAPPPKAARCSPPPPGDSRIPG